MEKPNQGRVAPAIPGAIGELIDKITILEIKEKHVSEAAKLDNIRFELTVLRQLRAECAYGGEQLKQLEAELKAANYLLWNAEDCSGNTKKEVILDQASSRWHVKYTKQMICERV